MKILLIFINIELSNGFAMFSTYLIIFLTILLTKKIILLYISIFYIIINIIKILYTCKTIIILYLRNFEKSENKIYLKI